MKCGGKHCWFYRWFIVVETIVETPIASRLHKMAFTQSEHKTHNNHN